MCFLNDPFILGSGFYFKSQHFHWKCGHFESPSFIERGLVVLQCPTSSPTISVWQAINIQNSRFLWSPFSLEHSFIHSSICWTCMNSTLILFQALFQGLSSIRNKSLHANEGSLHFHLYWLDFFQFFFYYCHWQRGEYKIELLAWFSFVF